ncbi:putative lipid II flippase FtsW [bacterium]|nr:putative lipid II flippase FtsW [bacterium]
MYYQGNYPNNPNNLDGSNLSSAKPLMSPPDKWLLITVVLLLVLGIMAVFSASAPKAIAAGVSPLHFVARQFIYLAMGVAGCWFFSKIDCRKLKPASLYLAWLVFFLLVLVEVKGQTVNGAKRWLDLGFIQFQPSEFAKPALVLCFATAFQKDNVLFTAKKLPYLIVFVAIMLLIFMQPNLSMLIILSMTMIAMYFCVAGHLKQILLLFAAMLPAGWLFFMQEYQKQRILTWLDPFRDPQGDGYNIIQSLIAFASGKFFGAGFGNSRQKLSWLPEGHTDFIFAIIAEEFGFLGCIFVIGLFATFVFRGLIISARSDDTYSKLLALGITFSIGFQALINMGVSSSMIPATGVPLPFISYGGSSLFVTMCMVGVLLNISKRRIERIPTRNLMYERR